MVWQSICLHGSPRRCVMEKNKVFLATVFPVSSHSFSEVRRRVETRIDGHRESWRFALRLCSAKATCNRKCGTRAKKFAATPFWYVWLQDSNLLQHRVRGRLQEKRVCRNTVSARLVPRKTMSHNRYFWCGVKQNRCVAIRFPFVRLQEKRLSQHSFRWCGPMRTGFFQHIYILV